MKILLSAMCSDVLHKSHELRNDGAEIRTDFPHRKRRTIVIGKIVMRHQLQIARHGDAAGENGLLNRINQIVVGNVQSVRSAVSGKGK